MALDIPTYSDLVLIKDSNYRTIDNLATVVNQFIRGGTYFLGTTCLKRYINDTTPMLLFSPETINLFPKGGIYFVGNPIPYIVTPIKVCKTEFLGSKSKYVYIYKAEFL